MNIQTIQPEDREAIRIQKRKEALKRAQSKYYLKNKEILDAKHRDYIKNNLEQNNTRANKYYKKLKEDPEQYKILSTYHKERYQRIKQIKTDSETDTGSGSE
jgi:hypothetical protein